MQKQIFSKIRKNKSGITLIALVITIIILIILAGITIQLTLGENGIIQNAKKAKVEYEIENYKERVEIARQNVAIDNLGEITLDKLVDQIYKEEIVPQGNITKQDENSQKMVTEEGYEFIITKDAIEYIGGTEVPEEPKPPVNIVEGTVDIGSVVWNPSTHTASVTLTKANGVEDNLQIQYQINGYEEEKWQIGTTVNGLTHNDTIYARLWNGSIGGKDYASRDIKDKEEPVINIQVTSTKTNAITVSITAQDNEYGMPEIPKYTYSIKKIQQEDSEYKKQELTATTNSFEGLEQTTSYTIKVETKDKAGNVGSKQIEVTTQTVEVASGNIQTTTEVWNLTTHTASISINKAQEMGNNLQIQYQINGYEEGKWQTGTTVNGLKHEDMVYIRLWDGVNAGNYTSREIRDGQKPQDADITWTSGTTVSPGGEITVQVILRDNESGVNIVSSKWMLTDSINPIGEDGNYTGGFIGNSTTQNITTSKSEPGTYFLHVLTQDKAGNKKETVYEEGITVGISINDLKAGDYVKFISNGQWRYCRVLYTADSQNGLQVVTQNSLSNAPATNVNWELSTFTSWYNSYFENCNAKTEEWVDNSLVCDGRVLGSNPSIQNNKFINKNNGASSTVILPESFKLTRFVPNRDTGCLGEDINYLSDVEALKTAKIWRMTFRQVCIWLTIC